MIQEHNVLVLDVDGTVCHLLRPGEDYKDAQPIDEMVERIREFKRAGWRIVFFTARRMRSLGGNLGSITALVVPELVDWLNTHAIPFDEIHVGKPWPGQNGFYVDDRAVRPEEFVRLSLEELSQLTGSHD